MTLPEATLSEVVDETLDWFVLWHRLAFIDRRERNLQMAEIAPPQGFALWLKAASKSVPENQPALERLGILHGQMHELARLILIKTPGGEAPAAADYEILTAKYKGFLHGIRQLEQVFAAASSGLDSLTGLRSRVGMFEDMAQEMGRFLRTGRGFCVAMMDIDYFKKINDTYGHAAGDTVLAAAADHVTRSLRVFDDAYRFGGEEFLICLKEVDGETGLKVIQRLCDSLAKLEIKIADGQILRITASFGLAAARRTGTIDGLVREADQALYAAKEGGRNRVVLATV